MKKLLVPLLVLLSSTFVYSQCEKPQPFTGNTGSNMTVMMTSSFVSSVTYESDDAYILAITGNGMVVGSVPILDITPLGTLTVWGDDSSTSEVDGALANESIIFQLVDGDKLYNLSSPVPVTFSTNDMVRFLDATVMTLDCETEVQEEIVITLVYLVEILGIT